MSKRSQNSPIPTSPADDTLGEEKMRARVAQKGYDSMVDSEEEKGSLQNHLGKHNLFCICA